MTEKNLSIIRTTIMTTFEENICLVLEDLDTFSNFCKKIHDIPDP